MISISPRAYDINGGAVFSEGSGSILRAGSRRVSRSANLDGTVTIVDGGFTHGDRTVSAVIEAPGKAAAERLEYMFQNYALVTLSIPDGCYIAAPQDYSVSRGDLFISLLIKETS